MDTIKPMDDWKKQQEAVKKRLGSMAKGSKSEVLQSVSKEKKMEMDKSVQQNCDIIRMLCNETCEMYREGDMELKPAIDDLCLALKAVATSKPTAKGDGADSDEEVDED